MLLDSLDRRLNIKGLTSEPAQKRTEVPFDPNRDISEQEWTLLSRFMREHLESNIPHRDFYSSAANFYQLDPRRWNSLGLNDFFREKAINSYRLPKTGAAFWPPLIARGAQLRIIAPDHIDDLFSYPDSLQGDFKKMRTSFKRNQGMSITVAEEYTIFFGKRDPSVYPDNTYVQLLNLCLADRDNPRRFAKSASRLRIVFPEHFDKLQLGKDDLRGMKKELDGLRPGSRGFMDQDTFLDLARNMYLLAAQEVTVSDKGVQIIPFKEEINLEPTAILLPEQRRF